MNTEFATAMRRASQETRVQNLTEATRLIQEALNGRGRDKAPETDPTSPRPELLLWTAPAQDATASVRIERSGRPRRPLSETLSALKSISLNADTFARLPGMEASGLQTRATPSVPEGARFETYRFACAAGSRSYRLYVPASAPEQPRGLVVMLHGCTQNPDDFAVGTGMNAVAETRGFAVAYPAQTRSDNANACWNWFEPKDQRRGAGEPAIIAGLTQKIVADYGIDPARVFIAGLSAGGAMAALMGETYPEVYAAVGVHSGLPAHAAKDVVSAFAAMRGDARMAEAKTDAGAARRIIVFQGSADRTVHPSNADRIIEAATPAAASTSTRQIAAAPGRRGASLTVVADPAGATVAEHWLVHGAPHAWSGGCSRGSYVDPTGPDASTEMMRFFVDEAPPL